MNDDTVLETPNWATKLIATLKTNPFVANFGVTGPLDSNNEKIFTHSFVHRTHIDVFGYHFPFFIPPKNNYKHTFFLFNLLQCV